MVHLLGIGFTGTSVNPARSNGPALFAGGEALAQLWLFIVAPLLGAVTAAGVHRLLVSGPVDDTRADPTTAAVEGSEAV